MLKHTLLSLTVIGLLSSPLVQADEVNIYSARQEALIKPLLDKFTESTGIKVNLVTGKDDALLEKLKLEGDNTPADVLITADAGRLYRAKEMGISQAIDSSVLTDAIPEQLRDPEKHWFGLTYRARPIMYATDRVKPEELSTYEALVDPKWQGRICIRSSSNIYNQSLVGSMIAADGVEKTQAWANAFVKNIVPPQGGDTEQIKAAAAGQCDIAIANTYYLARLVQADDEVEQKSVANIAVLWPNQGEGQRGTHINVSGAVVTKAAKHKDNAVKLLEFMTSDESQQWYSDVNGEYPVKQGVPKSSVLQRWGDFKADSVNLSELGKNNAEAVKIMDKAGWK